MNFITKNLGWIFLFLFFIFMLFIISTNDPQEAARFSSSGEIVGESNQEDLDSLVEEIKKEEERGEDIVKETLSGAQDTLEDGKEVVDETVEEVKELQTNYKRGLFTGRVGSGETLKVTDTTPGLASYFGGFGVKKEVKELTESGAELVEVGEELVDATLSGAQDTLEDGKEVVDETVEEVKELHSNYKRGLFTGRVGSGETVEMTDTTPGLASYFGGFGVKKEVKELTESGAELVETGEELVDATLSGTQDTLEDGKEVVDETVEEVNETTVEVVEDVQEGAEEAKEESKSIFERLFGKKDDVVESATGSETQSGTVASGSPNVENESSEDTSLETKDAPKDSDTFIVEKTTKTHTSNANLVKNSGNVVRSDDTLARRYAPEVYGNSINFPGKDLTTAVGKYYEVGVHSLKLNNKYFTQKLGYLMKGDVLRQTTPENSYGCFKVDVVRAARDVQVASEGYVCKKWLTNTDFSADSVEEVQEDDTQEDMTQVDTPIVEEKEERVTNYPVTHIGDIITISQDNVLFEGNVPLMTGDQIDQMSETDASGCFIAHVYISENSELKGKVGKVCAGNIYK